MEANCLNLHSQAETRRACWTLSCSDGFSVSPNRKLHNLSRQHAPALYHSHSKVLPGVQMWTYCVSSLCLLFLLLALGTTEKTLALSLLHSLFSYLQTLMKFPWTFSSPRWTVPALSASLLERCSSPVITFLRFHFLSNWNQLVSDQPHQIDLISAAARFLIFVQPFLKETTVYLHECRFFFSLVNYMKQQF